MKTCPALLSAICLTALCMVIGEEAGFPPWPEYYADRTPESIAFKRDAFRDPAKLKSELLQALSINGRFDFKEFPWFKSTFEVQDEVLRPVLMEIYKEARMKDFSDPNNGLDMLRAKRSLTGLGLCADDAAKQLLLDIASQSSDVMDIRMRALAAYLQASNAEEAKNVLLRFLVEEERMDDYARSSIYVYAKTVWDTASPEKKEAIFNALCVAASMESTQWVFEECDTRLIAMNASYKNSLQREAMLRRQLFIPFSKYYNELKIQMEKEVKRLEKVKNHSNISTNLAALKTRNFNLPQPDLATNNVIAAVEGSTVADEKTDSRTIRSVGMYAFFGVTTLLLLGLGAWKMTRR